MKNCILLLGLLFSFNSFAEVDCIEQGMKYVKPLARTFFDQVAEDGNSPITGLKFKFDFDSSEISNDWLELAYKVTAEVGFDESAIFSVKMNPYCGFESITLIKF
jgi:hypothetical protein